MNKVFHFFCLIFLGTPGIAPGQPMRDTPEKEEPPIIITAPAKLEPRGERTFLILADASRRFEIPWSTPGWGSRAISLEPGRVYTFTVLLEDFWGNARLPDVVRIEQNGKVLYDRDVSLVITAPALLVPHGDVTTLVIADGKHRFELPWKKTPTDKGLVPLESNRVYTFSIVEEPVGDADNIHLLVVVKVEQEGKTLYERGICEVHKVKMQRKAVPVVYGLIRPSLAAPSPDMEKQLFPHGREFVLGGCVVRPDSPKTRRVYVCPKCTDAYKDLGPTSFPLR